MIDVENLSVSDINAILAQRELIEFTKYTKTDYNAQWFHEYLAEKLDLFAEGKIKRLMCFMPPQHGKSELTTRRFPAYMLGRDPDKRIGVLSYNDNFAKKFNRQIQRIIQSREYLEVFPGTKLNSVNIVSSSKGAFLKNAHEFEVVDRKGGLMSVGVGGGITGNPFEMLLLDDVIKGRAEAESKVYREKVWDWWNDDVGTRIREETQIMITLTRWHPDDLCGRILADPDEAKEWEVIVFPALKEDNSNPHDPREVGEALWEEQKSRKSLEKIRDKKSRTFTSLYQQRPTNREGDVIKRSWFEIIPASEFIQIYRLADNVSPRLFASDTAYRNNSETDPCGFITFLIIDETIYIINFTSKRLTFPDYIKFLHKYLRSFKYEKRSRVFIEPKATGISVVQVVKRQRLDGRLINIYEDKAPTDSKYTRASAATDAMEAGRVKLVAGPWNDFFLDKLSEFRGIEGDEDEAVDLLVIAIDKLENGYDSGKVRGTAT